MMLPKRKKTTLFKFDKPCQNALERGPPRSEKKERFSSPQQHNKTAMIAVLN